MKRVVEKVMDVRPTATRASLGTDCESSEQTTSAATNLSTAAWKRKSMAIILYGYLIW